MSTQPQGLRACLEACAALVMESGRLQLSSRGTHPHGELLAACDAALRETEAPDVLAALKLCAEALKSGAPMISGDVTDYRLDGLTVYYALDSARAAIASAESAEGRAKGEADGYLHDDGYFTWATPSHREAYANQFAGWPKKSFYLAPQPPAVEGTGLSAEVRDLLQALRPHYGEDTSIRSRIDAALSATPPNAEGGDARDAKRLDYLIDSGCHVQHRHGTDNYWLVDSFGHAQESEHRTPRAAIDAAMEREA